MALNVRGYTTRDFEKEARYWLARVGLEGKVVQQGDPQDILMNPNHPYTISFISDINRARVLRVRSVMKNEVSPVEEYDADISEDENLGPDCRCRHGTRPLQLGALQLAPKR